MITHVYDTADMLLKWCCLNAIAYFGFSGVRTYHCMFVTNVSYEPLLMWKSVRDAPKSVEELHRSQHLISY